MDIKICKICEWIIPIPNVKKEELCMQHRKNKSAVSIKEIKNCNKYIKRKSKLSVYEEK